jgi:glycolate oxidase iron-sulfur subunit
MEDTRAALVSRQVPWWERLGYRALGRQRLLRFGSTLIAAAQRVGVVPRRLGLPRLPWRRASLTPTGDDVYLFTGCVMDAWQSPVHAATIRVITAAGAGVALPHRGSACCGALHEHAGLRAQARRLAAGVMATMPGTQPIVVNSAGCGAALKDYGRLLGTDEARAFAARVVDVHEWLAPRIDRLSLRPSGISVAVQDPCHLRHVQRTHLAVRTVLGPAYRLVELDDDGLCCGAGGAFSMHHGELAGEIRARKLEAIGRSGAPVVASANPGCSMHLAAAGATVRHPMELIDEVLPSGR